MLASSALSKAPYVVRPSVFISVMGNLCSEQMTTYAKPDKVRLTPELSSVSRRISSSPSMGSPGRGATRFDECPKPEGRLQHLQEGL